MTWLLCLDLSLFAAHLETGTRVALGSNVGRLDRVDLRRQFRTTTRRGALPPRAPRIAHFYWGLEANRGPLVLKAKRF